MDRKNLQDKLDLLSKQMKQIQNEMDSLQEQEDGSNNLVRKFAFLTILIFITNIFFHIFFFKVNTPDIPASTVSNFKKISAICISNFNIILL